MKTIRSPWMALQMAFLSIFAAGAVMAQTNPAINSFTVDQVAQVSPGTELIFRVNGTAGGNLSLRIDGSPNQIGLIETRNGVYEGSYTVSIRDDIKYTSKVNATLRVGQRQTTAMLGQTLLKPEAHAAAMNAASPGPKINRFETKTTGALSGGHEISFTVLGTPASKATVSMDGGKTSLMTLVEDKTGHYVGSYTIKTSDRFSESSQAVATLTLGNKQDSLSKSMAVAAVVPPKAASTSIAKCDNCGVITEINSVTTKGDPNYVGAVTGGVAGAVLGSQIGKGDGKTAATVLGAVGGAVAGREVEKRVRSTKHFDVIVKMDNGSMKTVKYENEPAFKVGQGVRLNGEVLVAQQ